MELMWILRRIVIWNAILLISDTKPFLPPGEHYRGKMVLSVLAVKICLLVSGIFFFWNVKTKKGNKGNINRPTQEIVLFEDVKLDDGAFSFWDFPASCK